MSNPTNPSIRVLFERSEAEKAGLLSYIHSLLEKRWTDPSLRGQIFAIPAAYDLSSKDPVYLDLQFNTLGNKEFAYTIIIPNLGQPTVVVIANTPYSFTKHFINTAAYLNTDNYVSVIAHQHGITTVIAVMHDYLIGDWFTNIANIPEYVLPIVNEVLNTYGARKFHTEIKNKLFNMVVKASPDLIRKPYSPNEVVRERAGFWTFIPKSPIPDSPQIQTGSNNNRAYKKINFSAAVTVRHRSYRRAI